MRFKRSYVAALVAAGAATVAIGVVPMGTAAPLPKVCLGSNAGTSCQSPGNVEITSSAPEVSFHPYGRMPNPNGRR